ncbi:MAG: response regulator, partial [Pseudomonadota bacterium]|nr:response regulator [Pseudomonadota bacterium]
LVVDDSEVAARFLRRRLESWGLQVECAAASRQALELLESRTYDLIFVDVELGPHSELDGLALCQRVKQSAAAVGASVIMVSAHQSELDRARGALAGCDAYLGKPLTEAELAPLLLRRGLARAPAHVNAG